MDKKLNFRIWVLCIALLLGALSLGLGNIPTSVRLGLIVLLIILVIFLSWRGEKKKVIPEDAKIKIMFLDEKVIPLLIPILYGFGGVLIALGVYFLFTNRPEKLSAFLGNVILGLIAIVGAFLISRRRRKRKEEGLAPFSEE